MRSIMPEVTPRLTPHRHPGLEQDVVERRMGIQAYAAARTTDTVTTATGTALRDITPQDIVGWFKSRAKYAVQT